MLLKGLRDWRWVHRWPRPWWQITGRAVLPIGAYRFSFDRAGDSSHFYWAFAAQRREWSERSSTGWNG